jgi:hypothetical protein
MWLLAREANKSILNLTAIYFNISCMPTVTKDMKKHSNSHNYVIIEFHIGTKKEKKRFETFSS